MLSKKIIKNLFLAILTSFSLLIELDQNTIIKMSGRSTISLTVLIVSLFIYNLYSKYNKKDNYIGFKALALLLSMFMLFGYSYDKLDSWYFVFGNCVFVLISIVKTIGYYIFFNLCIHSLYNYIKNLQIKKISNKLITKFNTKPFFYSIIIILIGWLPYIISFYPIILSPDPTNQIKQFFGIPTRYINGIKLVDPKVLMTNDNPFLHTVLLGGCTKIGHLIGNDNLGLFIYTIIQIIILLSALIYSLKYLKKINVPNQFFIATLLIYTLVPIFPLYAINAVKDVIFSALILIYIVKLYDIVRYHDNTTKDYISLAIITLGVYLSRNNGIYHILLSLPFTLFIVKQIRKEIILVLVSSIGLYFTFTNVGLSLLHVTPGNKREMFSIPFQQTARYVKYYGNDLTEEERAIIDKVLTIDTLPERYDPIKADHVKNGFNALSSNEDFSNYLKVWFRLFFRHPNVYIEATANNVFGYFYPNTSKWYIYVEEYKEALNSTGIFNYHYNNLKIPRQILSAYGLSFPYIPIIGMFVNIGFVVWLYFFMTIFLIKEKLYKYIVVLTPALSLILVCIASPANTYFRYALPFIYALPVTCFMLYNILIENKNTH